MDDSWRFRSIGGNICPICSTSHFPFCPHPPAFDRNGFPGENLRRFPPSFDYPFHRPLQGHPFTDYRPPPLTPAPAPAPAPPFPLTDPDFHPSHRFFQDEFMHREGFHKRMRVEDPNIGNIHSPPIVPLNRYELPPMTTGTSSENDRRLSLIRDHGRHDVALHGKDRNFQGFGVGSAARSDALPPPEPSFSHRNPPLSTYEEYQNYPVGQSSQSANGFPFQERRDFERGVFETSRNQSVVDPQIGNDFYGRNGQYNTSSQPAQSYRHSDMQYDSSSQLPQSNRHSVSVKDSESYVSHAPIERRSLYDSRPISYPAADYASRGPYEKYYSQDHEQFLQKEKLSSMVPENPQHFHSDSHRLLSTEIHGHEGAQLFHAVRHPIENRFELHGRLTEAVQTPFEFKPSVHEDIYKPFESQAYPPVEQYSGSNISNQKDYLPMPFHSNNTSIVPEMQVQVHNSQMYPPLPPQPLQGVHTEPPSANFGVMSSSTAASPMLSRAPASTSITMPHPHDISIFSESRPLPETKMHEESQNHSSNAFTNEMQGVPFIHQTSSKQYMEDGAQSFPFKHPLIEKQTIDACDLFKKPHRASRPDHIVVILRGLPGSGKSYLAKAIRDIEVENGANAPRIHAMDDYFMIEVEKKVEDNEGPNSSSTPRGKKQVIKKVVEFCYEPEMEESYRSSMLKAFKKTLDEGIFTFIIVDDRNLRVADFAQFWAIAKRSGYEVYLLEAAYKDPAGCAARNVHGFTLDDIQKMSEQFEEAPSFYLQLDIQSLFHGDDLNEHCIKEVDMDTDDAACAEEDTHELHNRECFKMESTLLDYPLDGDFVKAGDRWDTEEDQEITGVKELESSKWSKDLDEDTENADGAKGTLNALSGLIQAYGKGEKSVHWGDRVNDGGFSIAALKKKSISSLVIGPGFGYNLSSNPLPEDTLETAGGTNIDSSKRRFHDQLRAERESFKAVFDRRRQRIGGLFNAENE